MSATILIVDDDADVRATLQRFLELNGYEVLSASDGNLAGKVLAMTRVDLVVTDIIMPDKDGFGLIKDLRAHHEGVRIIAISGGGSHASASYLAAALKLGANAGFTKPLNFPELLRSIQGLLVKTAP